MRKISHIFLLLFVLGCNSEKVTYKPIGYFISDFTKETGAPRQGILMPDTKGQIILKEDYVEGLSELSNFEYIWVLFHFNKAKGWDDIVNPPESQHSFGIFSTRSPRRPNPIGMSLVKLDSIKNNVLFVSGVDMFLGTPILDIKPYLPSVDFVYSRQNIEIEALLGHHSNDFLNDSLVKIFIEGMDNIQDSVMQSHNH